MPDCRDCKYCFCECGEDIVCGHPKSYEETSFGLSVNSARRTGGVCGPAARLFEPRTGSSIPGKRSIVINIEGMDSNTFMAHAKEIAMQLKKPEPPRHAWEQDGMRWEYIDVKDQRILGEICCDHPQRFRALGFPKGPSCEYLGKFTSLDRAKQAVEDFNRPQDRREWCGQK